MHFLGMEFDPADFHETMDDPDTLDLDPIPNPLHRFVSIPGSIHFLEPDFDPVDNREMMGDPGSQLLEVDRDVDDSSPSHHAELLLICNLKTILQQEGNYSANRHNRHADPIDGRNEAAGCSSVDPNYA